jgi:2-C-methyl-D-erythritol 2,4-cyclodiphosphate synthase
VTARYRIGHGYDVHRFVEGRPLILGGVEIPFEKGLQGHSDADALLHAICDAMLGAVALGDIGRHFPDTDERFRGISSLTLLESTNGLIRAKGYAVVNVDTMIVVQRPKIGPYVNRMRERIAETLGIDAGAVSVKATTSEGLGFTGTGDGLVAQAVVLLEWQENQA